GTVPLVPISTGTNNVWPAHNEGTLAGMAAALVARSAVPPAQAIRPTRRLEVQFNGTADGGPVGMALVGGAACDMQFTGSKAVWQVERLREIVLADVRPGTLGLSSIGGGLPRPAGTNDCGLHVRIGGGGCTVVAAIAPGVVGRVPIQEHRWL